MKHKESKISTLDPTVKRLFNGAGVGGKVLNPLTHKDGTPLKDWEYFEAVGRRAIAMDAENKSRIATDYMGMDRDVVNVAKQVVEAIDSGKATEQELTNFIAMCMGV